MKKSPFIRSGGVEELETFLRALEEKKREEQPPAADTRAGA